MNRSISPTVAVIRTPPHYPDRDEAEFAPVVAALAALGLDPDNPFADWVGPGGSVTLKPNWVMHQNPLGYDLDSLVTHPAVIFCLAERAARALRGSGTITIGDAPLQGCEFAALQARAGISARVEQLRARHPGIQVNVEDWRLTVFDRGGLVRAPTQSHRHGSPDSVAAFTAPDGYSLIDLGRDSFLEELAELSDRFRVTCYRPSLMAEHHAPGRHEYLVRRRVLDADLVINVPKLKTHIKAGLTGALKNLVGINGHKEFLPHHLHGSWQEGGDCYQQSGRLRTLYDRIYDYTWENLMSLSRVRRTAMSRTLGVLARINARIGDGIDAGSWSGNETIWRTTLDLNHVLYAHSRARILHVVDGVIAGQGEGPLQPDPHPAGVVIAGENPAHVDAAIARMIGYSLARIPTVYHALTHRRSRFAGLDPDAIPVLLTDAPGTTPAPCSLDALPDLALRAPRHWRRAKPRMEPDDSSRPRSASGEW